MKAVFPVAVAALAVTACALPAPQGEATGERRVSYQCRNGPPVEMRFFPLQGVAVLVRNGQTLELQQQPAASGFVYGNGPNTVRGKGDELVIEIGRMVPIQCKAD